MKSLLSQDFKRHLTGFLRLGFSPAGRLLPLLVTNHTAAAPFTPSYPPLRPCLTHWDITIW